MTDRVVAAFDFDGTVTRRDTLVPFLARSLGRGVLEATLRRGRRIAFGDGHWRDRAKVHAVAPAASGMQVDRLEEAGRVYAERLPALYRPDVVERIGWHRERGDELVMVTASLGVYARPAGLALGFDRVIAVELASAEGVYTGELAGPNVRGAEKRRLLLEHLAGSPATIWAYGDSAGDDEMLGLADHPHRVSRSGIGTGGDLSMGAD